jgi:putative addiction module antidote
MGTHVRIKVQTVGKAHGVIIPSEILEQMHVKAGGELFLIVDSTGVRLAPYAPELEAQLKAVDSVSRKYADVFEALSK